MGGDYPQRRHVDGILVEKVPYTRKQGCFGARKPQAELSVMPVHYTGDGIVQVMETRTKCLGHTAEEAGLKADQLIPVKIGPVLNRASIG